MIGRPEDLLMVSSLSRSSKTSSTSSAVMPCSAMCYTLPSESSARVQIILTSVMPSSFVEKYYNKGSAKAKGDSGAPFVGRKGSP